MPPNLRESGMEFMLEAIRADVSGYSARVESALKEVRDDMRDHRKNEEEWRRTIESDLRKAITVEGRVGVLEDKAEVLEDIARMEPRVGALEVRVGEHHSVFEKTKGAIIGAKALWALIGVLIGGLGWLYSHLVAPSQASAPMAVRTIYLPVGGPAPSAPANHNPAASSEIPRK